MVGVFRRSLSFPNKPAAARQPKPRISRHLRSISLPCRSHPLISSLNDEIANLRSWSSSSSSAAATSAWLCRGLAALKLLHDYLDDILQLPQSRDSICRLSTWIENVLEDFLRFIDAYGIFQNLLLALRQHHVAAHLAIRRNHHSKLDLYSKARKKIAKDTTQLVSALRCVRTAEAAAVSDEELAGAIKDVMDVTGMVSVAVFDGIAVSLGRRPGRGWMGKKKKKKVENNGILEFVELGRERLRGVSKKDEDEVKMTMEKIKDLEEWIGCIESGTEKVFRTLINTRVSILNALSH